MGSINIKLKIMPSGVLANLDEIKKKVKKKIESEGGKGCIFEEEPIAFGLKAVIVMFLYPEEKEFEHIENELGEIENVNSVQVIDMRRAL
ncbi:MAG TPA: elongation factor 1-beta [Candidatus Nanoarchaeia archaeon]|nr:elongation factor 1-beta [Candidatus Nanoarchaeia archaeon]